MNKLGREELEMTTVKKDFADHRHCRLFAFYAGELGNCHYGSVESNYTLTAVEMLRSGDYISPRIYGNYWYDKPAFFYWELIAAYKLME